MSTDISSSSTESYDSTVSAPATGDPRTSASVRTPMQSIVNRIRFGFARLQEIYGTFLPIGSVFPVAASVSGNTFTIAGHGLSTNDPFRVLSVGGSVPAPLVAGTTYFAGSVTSNTFTALSSSGGSVVTLTNTGSGTIYVAKRGAVSFYQITADGLETLGNALTVAGSFVANGQAIFNSTITQSGGANVFGGDTTVGGYLRAGKAQVRDSTSIPATVTTFTVDASKPVWVIDTPFPGSAPGGTMVITVDKLSVIPPADAEIEVVALNMATHTASIGLQRNDGTVLTVMNTPDKSAKTFLKYLAGTWRVVGFTGASTTITTA